MRKYSNTNTAELRALWDKKREEYKASGDRGVLDDLFEIRSELSRRNGDMPPSIDVNFESYTTD